ncbi:MAG: DUF6496 domain-containing protein [Thermoproteota archaeon]
MNSQNSPEQLKREKIRKVMREFKEGKLRSSSGKKVLDRKQAIAIALSEASRLLQKGRKRR